jgi:putative DNA primase/helicase
VRDMRVVPIGSKLTQSFASLCAIVRERSDALWGDKRLRFDLMRDQVVLGDADLTDTGLTSLREIIERKFTDSKTERPLRFGLEDIHQAVRMVAEESAFHPVEEYLRELEWDGVARLEMVAQSILLNGDPLVGQLVRKWFVSAAARALRPGCKVDTVLVLVGTQGGGKSTFFRALMPQESWFSDSDMGIGTRDAYQALHSRWIFEWSELESMRKADESAVKAFVSSQADTYRPPYGRMPIHRKRRSVIVGTTNRDQFLRDDTGDRRFWVVPTPTGKADRQRVEEAVSAQRDQLWAEAAYRLEGLGETWWLDEVDEEAREQANERHRERDVWADAVESWLASSAGVALSGRVTTAQVLADAVGKPVGQSTRADEMRVAAVLRAAGFEQQRRRLAGERVRYWVRSGDA